jgi:GTPase SAR1 family protein
MTETPPHSPDISSPDAALGSDSLWSAPASLAPDPVLLQQVGYLTAEPKHDCVLLGPAGVGKSSFLSVLGRACQGEEREGFKVAVSRGAALAELAGKAARFVAGDRAAMAATEEPASYDFQVTVESQTAEPEQPEVIAQDLPGGEIFGSPGADPPLLKRSARAKLWLQAARRASCLILCVDAMHPDRLRWEILLPQLIEDLSVSSGRLIARLSRLGQPDVPPALSPKRQLPYKKILVLLTKIDQVCAAVASATAANRLPASRPIFPFLSRLVGRPREFAAQLDPVRLAEDRLGKAFLGQLRAAAAPDTCLAVGLVSAWGFGQSDAREQGGLEAWLPFGIRESVLFIATGEARQPVKALPQAASAKPQSSNSILLPLGGHR